MTSKTVQTFTFPGQERILHLYLSRPDGEISLTCGNDTIRLGTNRDVLFAGILNYVRNLRYCGRDDAAEALEALSAIEEAARLTREAIHNEYGPMLLPAKSS